RELRPPKYQLVDYLRPGYGERQPARLRHDLPDPGVWRGHQLGERLFAGGVPGDAPRQCRRAGGPGPGALHSEHALADGSATPATGSAGPDEPATPGPGGRASR